jgi:hypothetical protein
MIHRPGGVPPSNSHAGDIYYNTMIGEVLVYNGQKWRINNTNTDTFKGQVKSIYDKTIDFNSGK